LSYSSGIPNGTDALVVSQGQIRANYQAINNVFSNNHFVLTGNNNFLGMHTFLRMVKQGSDPTTDATHIAFYNKLVSSIPALFFAPNSAQPVIQLTYPSISTYGSPATSGLSFSSISGITNGSTTTITTSAAHNLNIGQQVIFTGIVGTTELNDVQATVVTTPTGSSFTISVATTNPWSSGGKVLNLLQWSFVAGPFVVYGGLIKSAISTQTITLTPTTTLKYVGLTTANVLPVFLGVVTAAATNITGSSFTISCQTAVSGKIDVYYLAIGQ
jgi:hypothetical protein